MKKLFTLVVAAAMTIAVSAQTVVYDYRTKVGYQDYSGTTTIGGVKINTNSNQVDGIKFANSLKNTDGIHYAKITPAEGGFKAGDVVSIAGCYNNSSEKETAVAIASSITAEGVATNIFKTSPLINGRLSADTPAAETFTLENDCEALYLYRDGGTTTYVIALTITRPESGPKANITLTYEKEGAVQFGYLTSDGTSLMVDWGNGTPVEVKGTKGDYDDYYTVDGTVTGNVVKIYSENITVLDAGYVAAVGNHLTALDVTNAATLQNLAANTNLLTTVDVTKNTELLKLNLANNPTTSIDLANCTKLTRLELQGTAATPGSLETIDLSKNTLLTYISLNYNKLKTVDFSANAKAASIYALNNQIESVVLPENSACTYISLNNNKLTSFDGANLTAMTKSKGSIFLMNNNISELKNIATKSLNVTGNKLTISTMPDIANVTTLTNAGQQAMEVAATVTNSIDLSSEADNGSTTYAVYNEDGTAVDAANYTVEGGVITFTEALNGKNLYVAMTNATYKFTGANVLKTTTFAVSVPTGINAISNVAPKAVMYNLAGQRVNANAKGIVVMNGKKVIK